MSIFQTNQSLGGIVATIPRAHGVNHKELFNLHKLYHLLKADLEQHFYFKGRVGFHLSRP